MEKSNVGLRVVEFLIENSDFRATSDDVADWELPKKKKKIPLLSFTGMTSSTGMPMFALTC